jgi:hypothetical protein
LFQADSRIWLIRLINNFLKLVMCHDADADLPSTIVRTSRQIISGAGLTGGGDLSADRTLAVGAGLGITVNADDVALTTPGTLTVATTNNSTGNHTHAITSSSNPGASASLLSTTAAGLLTLDRFAINGSGLYITGDPYAYYEVARLGAGGNPDTGTLKITLPKFGSSTMMRLQIVGYQYQTGFGAWECILGGYNFNTTTWSVASAEIRGNAPFSSVRFGWDGTNNIILLGTLSTDWYYAKIIVQHMVAGHNNQTGWETGWALGIVSSEAGITIHQTPAIYHAPPDYRTLTAGAGLTGGGDLTANRTFAVGAGTMITVNADDVQVSAGANYQFIGTGSGTAAGWRNVSELAGSGLTAATGVLSVGAGLGITVNADDVALTTPGTLTVSTTNSSTGSHTLLLKLRHPPNFLQT